MRNKKLREVKELASGTTASKWVNGKWNSGLLDFKPTFTNLCPTGCVPGRAVVSVVHLRMEKAEGIRSLERAVCQASYHHAQTGTSDTVCKS